MDARICAFVTGLLLCCLSSVDGGDWPAFRGPHGNGLSDESSAPTQWGPQKNVKWKVALPQPCNGSPVVAGGKVFLTCAEDNEGKLRSLYCFDRTDGKQLWVRTVDFGKKLPTHETNPYCGTTPAATADRVVVWHGSAGLHCYDLAGEPIWSRDLGEFRHMWGYGTSPVIHGNRVILHTGPGSKVFLTALDLATGETVWTADEPLEGDGDRNDAGKPMGSWCTPLIVEVNGQEQIICVMPTRIVGYNPIDGKPLWTCAGVRHDRGDLAYSSPTLAGNICVVTGGYRGPALGVRLGETGDLTETARLWRNENNPQSIGSGVFLNGFVYRPNAGPGTIECLNPATGETVWTGRAGGNFWGSIVVAAGRCYVTDQSGTTVVFQPNPERFELLAENKLGEPSNSTPAVSDGEFFIRTHQNLYCIAGE